MKTIIKIITYISGAGLFYFIGLFVLSMLLAATGSTINGAIEQASRILPPVVGLVGIAIAALLAAGFSQVKSAFRRKP